MAAGQRLSARRRVLLAYALALGASTLGRALAPAPELEPGEERLGGLAVRRSGQGPAVVLLHGSPGSNEDLEALAQRLSARHEVLVPDLPGFGASPAGASLSFPGQAQALLAMLDDAGLSSAFFVGHSLGGAVAITVADLAPARVRGLALVGSVGVVELELLGDPTLNHGIHEIQTWTLRGILALTPHFGLLDRQPLNLGYARSFSESDQRPLRGALERWEGPTLIVHGEADALVPVAAAREHARIVPQAELQIRPEGDHFEPFTDPAGLASTLEAFFARPLAAPTAERLAAAQAPFDPAAAGPATGMGAWILGLALAAATFVSEDLTCLVGGALAGQGRISLWAAILACMAGIFVGDLGLVAAGRLLGRPAIRRAPLRWFVSEAAVARASAWVRQNGGQVVFGSRFVPGMRLPTYVAMGVLKVPLGPIVPWFLLAALAWTPLLVGLASVVGERVEGLGPALGALVLLAIALRTMVPLLSWRGRRLALSSWRRWSRWEFWPSWLFYPPIVAGVAPTLARHGWTAWTAVNPGIPHSGTVGESKWEILQKLGNGRDPRVARAIFLPAAAEGVEAEARLRRALGEIGLPCAVKPEAGQRGQGVRICRNEEELREALSRPIPLLVQEYVPGEELGVFYARHPAWERGRIISVTHKRPLDVVGDGRSTLEELILRDDRAVCMAPTHLRVHAERLGDVPAPGQRVRLVEIGTHARGSVFVDGAGLLTPELELAVDELTRGFEGGFFFGRYDLRGPIDELRAGRFRAVELNGVTSESTHIYDPSNPLSNGWKTMIDQWKLATEIGAANVAAGRARATPLPELLRLILEFEAPE